MRSNMETAENILREIYYKKNLILKRNFMGTGYIS